jgi:hypothetical protein
VLVEIKILDLEPAPGREADTYSGPRNSDQAIS